MRRARGAAIEQFFDNLSAGEPIAIAMAVGFVLLLVFVAGVAIYDRKQRNKEKKSSGREL